MGSTGGRYWNHEECGWVPFTAPAPPVTVPVPAPAPEVERVAAMLEADVRSE